MREIDPNTYGIVERKVTNIIGCYEQFFTPFIGKGISMLELGVWKGASLRFWHDYFKNASIVGLDVNISAIKDMPNEIQVYQGYQQDTGLLDHIAQEQAPHGFDIIIDDCSHIGRFTRISFWHLFQNHLKPGGFYAIEDWGTGYFSRSRWPDGGRYKTKSKIVSSRRERLLDSFGLRLANIILPLFPNYRWLPQRLFISPTIRSHNYGMAGFIKELLDVCAQGETTIPRSGNGRYIDYGISRIHINRWLVIVEKASTKQNTVPFK